MAIFFVECYAKGRWAVAIPTDPEATAAVSWTARQRRSESAEFMRVGIPIGRVIARSSDRSRFDSEEREGGEGVAVTTTGARGIDFRDAAARLQE